MKKIIFFAALLLIGLAFFLFFFAPAVPEYYFLITLDTTRADYLEYAMVNKNRTPNLAGLAAAGTYYENAYSVIPITLPSHAAIFFSLPPHVLKLYNNGQIRPIGYPSLAEIFKKNGYATGAVISLAVLNKEFGLQKGFDFYAANFPANLWYKSAAQVNRDAFALIKKIKGRKAFIWLHYSDPHEPYFPPGNAEKFFIRFNGDLLFSSLSTEQPVIRLRADLHPGENTIALQTALPPWLLEQQAFTGINYADFKITPQGAGARVSSRFSADLVLKNERHDIRSYYSQQVASTIILTNHGRTFCPVEISLIFQLKIKNEIKAKLYESEIKYMDGQIGALIAFLKKEQIYDKAVFLIMGDHGEGLGEYQSHFGHIHYLNKIYTRVPFIVSGKGIAKRGRQKELVSNFNVAPTLLDLARIKKPTYMVGQSVFKLKKQSHLFLATYSPEAYFDAFSMVNYPWQIIFYPGRPAAELEFLNLDRDRFGTSNLINAPDQSGQRSNLISSVLKLSRIITAKKRNRDSLNKKTMDKLKSLGYL